MFFALNCLEPASVGDLGDDNVIFYNETLEDWHEAFGNVADD